MTTIRLWKVSGVHGSMQKVAVARIAEEVAREALPKLVWARIVASDVMDTGKI